MSLVTLTVLGICIPCIRICHAGRARVNITLPLPKPKYTYADACPRFMFNGPSYIFRPGNWRCYGIETVPATELKTFATFPYHDVATHRIEFHEVQWVIALAFPECGSGVLFSVCKVPYVAHDPVVQCCTCTVSWYNVTPSIM